MAMWGKQIREGAQGARFKYLGSREVRRVKWKSGASFEMDKRVWLLPYCREPFTV